MSVYKSLLSKDITITPFVVHKNFSFEGIGEITSSSIDVLWGVDYILNETNPENAFSQKTGYLKSSSYSNNTKPYRKNIFSSIKQLYYGNYASSSISSGSYISSFSNTVNPTQFFPTSSNVGNSSNPEIVVFSIPKNLYGEYIQPGSFKIDDTTEPTTFITDDKEGNLIAHINPINKPQIGNIFYEQGIAVLTSPIFNGGNFLEYISYKKFKNYIIKFKSSKTIYETQYKCTLRESEFNYSLNPSLLNTPLKGKNNILNSGSSEYVSFVTEPEFSPYITTVGLYNEKKELLAIGKLAQPLPTSQTTDTTILINMDR